MGDFSEIVEMPECPRGHGSYSVVFGGRYGARKQLYKCYPADGSKPHRFAPTLPRQALTEHTCWECENTIHAHEGPRTARSFSWPLRTAARALGQVGAGSSYVSASRAVRDLTVRDRGTLVADWVEVFTGPLWGELGPKSWPQFLVADSKPFYVRDWSARRNATGRPSPGEKLPAKVAFTLLTIVGADAPAAPTKSANWSWKPVMVHAVPGANVSWKDWAYLFSLLPGTPKGITADNGNGILNAAYAWWPSIELSVCLHHSRKGFIEAVPARIWTRYGPTSTALADTAEALLDDWAKGPAEMKAFVNFAHDKLRQYQPVRSWLGNRIASGGSNVGTGLTGFTGIRRADLLIQMASRTYPHGPLSNSAAENTLRTISNTWGTRAYSFRNAERTNRLLKLMVLSQRGAYDEREWTTIISDHLTLTGGRPKENLREISDHTAPTLRPWKKHTKPA